MPSPKPAFALALAATFALYGAAPALSAAAKPKPGKKTPASKPAAARTGGASKAKSPVRFVPEVLELGPGEEDILEVRLTNTYGHPTVGSFKLLPTNTFQVTKTEWDGPLPAWGAKTYLRVRAAKNAEPGLHHLKARYYVDRAGDYPVLLPVRVKIPVAVEVIPDYANSAVRVQVKNLLSNRTERGKVELRNPDRLLQDQVSAILPPIPPGETREVSIPVIGGGIAPGEQYRFDVKVATWPGYETSFTRHLKFYDAPR
ncbi:MAG: hypothetical protein KY468_13660 [Armatimonadetes bacterium]|nr:hypothetical protein [Armatimonadota bacterium]